MNKPLVVVESPTKVRTLKKYLGKDYNIAATVGHIKDLPDKELGIDIEEGFKPKYRTIPGKQKVITQLRRAAGDTHEIFLAPDPDREGEAIAWHTAEVLKKKGRRFHRVLFHELTQRAIKEAMERPLELDPAKYEAQQTRRILDRLVGYQLSPLLWRKVKSGLSAGRVQSVAVRIICDRERAIQQFVAEEYWSITAHLEASAPPAFTAKLVKKDEDKIKIPNEQAAKAILQELKGTDLTVDKVVKKTTRKNPPPPFTTSKLQQEAIRKLRFSARKTMLIAQQLYEGIDLGPGEPVGLITYMRTDSTRISQEAAQQALEHVRSHLGERYAMSKPRFFKNKNKAQDAHEAIRPTAVANTPEQLAPYLTKDQQSLYNLIWRRFVSSQMAQALIDRNSVSIRAASYRFSASGSSIKFQGFMALYQSAEEESKKTARDEQLPELTEGERLKLLQFEPKQHFTQPPPRFSEASLVKELEENGIGRPSTYANILSTIREKHYVELIKGYFRPTELGFIVNDILVDNFPDILDVEFTARMEDSLDHVETTKAEAQQILARFYGPFKRELEAAAEGMLNVKGVGLPTGLSCPQCGQPLHIKMGRNGHFLACSGYPQCDYSRDYIRDEKGNLQPIEPVLEVVEDAKCDKCGRAMALRQGKFGKFLACSGYPECKHTQSLTPRPEAQDTGVACPAAGCSGTLLQKQSRRGKVFYGCSRYPDCDYALWDKPVDQSCPRCQAPFLVEKTTKKAGTFLACPHKACGHRE